MNNTDWDCFRYFIAAAECGSLTGAAKQLSSNQPTVGRQIDALEHALGVKLFQRSVKGLILTEEGSFVFEQSQLLQSVVEKIERNHQGNDKDIRGTVRLALPEGICMEVFAPLLPSFYSAHPKINLILNVSSNASNLTRGEADIAVRLFRPQESNIVTKYLGCMTMGLFASASYIKNYGCPLTTSDLKHHRIITYGDQLSTLAENQWLVEQAGSTLSILSSDNTIARLKATVAGVGISVQPQLFRRMNPQLMPVLEGTQLPDHEVWIAYHKDLRHLARIRAVVDFISKNIVFNTT
ncbi:MAG: LysR family transcriptional regulator [Gammaproteobacteria bacterium]|nr:LysR family transcriptional regulator [Gammaproteobacteria bacterium]